MASAQKALQPALRGLAARPAPLSRPLGAAGLRLALAPAIRAPFQSRPTTSSAPRQSDAAAAAPPAPGADILVQQRLRRPVSPNIGIYKAQVTWYASAAHRITGSVLSGGLYIFGFVYMIHPLFGWSITSAGMAAAVAGWPVAVKLAAKVGLAYPFLFHSFNGVRHLVWDTGRGFHNQTVTRSGFFVVGLSAVAALGLCFL